MNGRVEKTCAVLPSRGRLAILTDATDYPRLRTIARPVLRNQFRAGNPQHFVTVDGTQPRHEVRHVDGPQNLDGSTKLAPVAVRVGSEVFQIKPASRRAPFPRLHDALVNRLASAEAFVCPVPVGNHCLAQLPAQQQNLSFNFAGKIQ